VFEIEVKVAKNIERLGRIHDDLISFKKETELGVKPGIANWDKLQIAGPDPEKVMRSHIFELR
jgi:hypothetical protein